MFLLKLHFHFSFNFIFKFYFFWSNKTSNFSRRKLRTISFNLRSSTFISRLCSVTILLEEKEKNNRYEQTNTETLFYKNYIFTDIFTLHFSVIYCIIQLHSMVKAFELFLLLSRNNIYIQVLYIDKTQSYVRRIS